MPAARLTLATLAVLVLGAACAPASWAAVQASIACAPACEARSGATLTFRSTSTSSSPIRSHEWDLDGDRLFGPEDSPPEPYGPTAIGVQRAFPVAGSFPLSLRVTNARAEQSTATVQVTIALTPGQPPPPPPPPGSPPTPGEPPPPPPDPSLPAVLPLPDTSDLDADRTPLRLDACPGTPRGTPPLWRGCAAADLVRGASLVAGGVLGGLGEATRPMRRERGFGAMSKRIGLARPLITRAAALLEDGESCPASAAYVAALRHLRLAGVALDRSASARRRDVTRTLGAAADVSPAAMALAMLELKLVEVKDALVAVRRASPAFTGPCRALGKPFRVRARVLETDDATGVIRLAGGTLLVVPQGARRRGPVAEGSTIRVEGRRFKDGTGLAGELTSSEGKGSPGLTKVRCMSLRIAPVQPLPPWAASPGLVLHDPAGYREADGQHVLEDTMRFGVQKNPVCKDIVAGGKVLRYSARIQESVGLVSADLALDLEEGESSAPVGAVVATGGKGKLRVTPIVQACLQLANAQDVCDAPVEQAAQLISFSLKELGSRAAAVYQSTIFGVKDNDLTGDNREAKVTGLELKAGATAATGFEATGYTLENGAPTRPQTRQISLGEEFRVYADDFLGPDEQFPLFSLGIDTPSALTWPHVTGTRNGKPFWYSAKLPRIVRDRIANCYPLAPFTVPTGPPNPNAGPDDPPTYPPAKPFTTVAVGDSFYRLPFPKDVGPGTGYMNVDDPTPPGRHGTSQAYAYDLGAPSGTPVLAARGGEVVLLEDDDPYNSADAPAGWTKIGNFVWLRHEDGSYAVYFHNKKDTAKVKAGDIVRRGEQLAQTGETGQASGPHVHFGLFTKQGLDFSVFDDIVGDLRARFELLDGAAKTPEKCAIPRNGTPFFSNNALPLGD